MNYTYSYLFNKMEEKCEADSSAALSDWGRDDPQGGPSCGQRAGEVRGGAAKSPPAKR